MAPVAFADDGPSPSAAAESTSVAEIVVSHFDAVQRDGGNASRTAKELRGDILSSLSAPWNVEVTHEVADAIVNCMDCAMASIATAPKHTKKEQWHDSVTSTLELAAAVGGCVAKDDGGATLGAVMGRAAEYGTVDKDAIRVEACTLLGMCVKALLEGGRAAPSALRKKGATKSKKAVASAGNVGEKEGWKAALLVEAGTALLPRATDKIAKVRGAGIGALASLLSDDAAKLVTGTDSEELFKQLTNSIEASLSWLMANDPSAPNRAAATHILPATEDNVPGIVERIKDVDGKVREAAIDSLRDKVDVEQLEGEVKVEILRNGLTKRCSATYAKTVELLCASWLKSTKFDPLSLLETLDPVLNETVCENAARVLLRVANTIDCEEHVERGVELVQRSLGGPEVRELREQVLRKRNVMDIVSTEDDGEEKEEDEDVDAFGNAAETKADTLNPALALFLRVKCDDASGRSDAVVDVITDIPTLCNFLESRIDALIAFNSDEDLLEDMDEDDAAALEDAQSFVCLQLIRMAEASELREEGSRRHFVSIMRRVLARLATPDDLVEACVRAMAAAHDKEAQFLQTVSEILVDVEDDDTFNPGEGVDERAVVIVRQMRAIAILNVALESGSAKMVGHPILDGFLQHLSPAITSKNAIVREHGVMCLSKFCLLSTEEKVLGEFRPLLLTVAGRREERAEVRARAAMALCDLALIHPDMMLEESSDEGEEGSSGEGSHAPSVPFKAMLLEMLAHSKPAIAIIAAEIAAKLLLAGRVRDPELVAWLVLIYFDAELASEADNGEDLDGDGATKAGSPVRLQQLLSVFFPTYAMSSLDANDDLMASVGLLIQCVHDKLEGRGKEALARWPIEKMIQYICHNVDLADKKKNLEGGKAKKAAEAADGEDETETAESDAVEGEGSNDAQEDAAVDADGDEVVVEASSTLLASIDVAEFLAEDGDSAPQFYARALAKVLGSARIDVDAEDRTLLRRLKSAVDEAEYANDDSVTVRAIRKLADLLVDVKNASDDEQSVSSVEENDEEAEETEEPAATEVDASVEKENPRASIGSVKSARQSVGSVKSTKTVEDGDRRLSNNRTSLGDVSCN